MRCGAANSGASTGAPRCPRGGHVGPWWAGLSPKPGLPHDRQNAGLPRPVLRAYAFTEWSWDTPTRPNGTDLWVPNGTHQFSIWYSWLNWQDVFNAAEPNWRYMGEGQLMAIEEDWTAL